MKTTILIADPQRLVRDGIRQILMTHEEFDVVAEAEDGRTAVDLACEKRPDVAILEALLPRLSGIDALRRIREESRRTACIVLSTRQNPELVKQALIAGAAGFVPKDAAAGDLLEAVRSVRMGRSYLAPTIADQVVSALRSPSDAETGATADLTARQREVLQLIAEGLSSKEIAGELGISLKTAQTHRAKLMGRIGVHKTSGLVRYAIREGIVSA